MPKTGLTIAVIMYSELGTALNKHKLENNHFKAWLGNGEELMVSNNQIELSFPGREKAQAILQEIVNPAIETGIIKFGSNKSKSSKSKKSKAVKDDTGTSTASKSSSKLSPTDALDELLKEGYFSTRRQLGEILTYLKEQKALNFQTNSFNTVLVRGVTSKKVKRKKNKSNNQYEYFV